MAKGAPWELEIIAFSASAHHPTQSQSQARTFSVNNKGCPPAGQGAPGRWGGPSLRGLRESFPPHLRLTSIRLPHRATAPRTEGMAGGLLLQVSGEKEVMKLMGLGAAGSRGRRREGEACAHLREGACRQLEFLLKQGTQHLVLPFQVKHPLLQLDALLPQVLSPGRWRETRRGWQGGGEG